MSISKLLDDSDELPAELKIPSRLLSDLVRAKANQMKAVGAMKEMPAEDAENTEGPPLARAVHGSGRDRSEPWPVAKFQLNSTVYPEADPATQDSQHKATQPEHSPASGPRSAATVPGLPAAAPQRLRALPPASFCQYEKHRQLILEDLFASLARLPSSKRSLRSFRLNSEESIQMLTALSLLLVQSVVLLPAKVPSSIPRRIPEQVRQGGGAGLPGIFEKFVEDLLLAVNKPEWPAAEMFLSLLGGLLVKQFADRSVWTGAPCGLAGLPGHRASSDCGKDAVTSEMSEQDLDSLVAEIAVTRAASRPPALAPVPRPPHPTKPQSPRRSESSSCRKHRRLPQTLKMWTPRVHYAVRFYLAQWYKDCAKEVERTLQQQRDAANNDESAGGARVAGRAGVPTHRSAGAKLRVRRAADSQQLASKRRLMSTGRSDAYMLDYEEACLVCRYLASMRPFSQSFDIYLSQILKVLNEQSVAVRTKAIKCLTAVVEVDPSVLERADIERTVHGRLLDNSTSVREACIELIGKFIIVRPQLTAQYYGMLSERILDTGISVRKRGHSKLVNEVFQAMWFSPVKESHNVKLLQKVMNITDVVAACKDQGYDWFEGLLRSLLKEEKEEKLRPVEKACRQIVDTLVANIMRLEEISSNNNQRLVACLCTLYMLTKIRPNLMVDHASTLQSYLKIKISSQQDNYVLHYVAKDSGAHHEEELRSIEQEMVQLTMRKGMMVLDSAIACLSAVVNRVTHNYSLIRSCFNLFYTPIDRQQQENMALAPSSSIPGRSRQSCAACTPASPPTRLELSLQRVFSSFMFFCSQCADPDVVKKSLMALASCAPGTRTCCFRTPLKTYYCELIAGPMVSDETKTLEEASMVQSTPPGRKHACQQESLKEMHDVQSGKGQHGVAQAYLDHVSPRLLAAFYYKDAGVRLAALTMVVTILRQGLIHPPSSNMRALFGLRQGAFQLPAGASARPRGCAAIRDPDADPPVAIEPPPVLHAVRTNRHERAGSCSPACSTSTCSDENPSQRAPLAELLYVADNLASFPYQVAEEPPVPDPPPGPAGGHYLGFAPGTELPDGCTPADAGHQDSGRTRLQSCYGISDSKERAKLLALRLGQDREKRLNRRSIPGFGRRSACLDYLASESVRPTTVKMAADILDFEDLMLTIDPNDAGGASGEMRRAAAVVAVELLPAPHQLGCSSGDT
uniref:Nipped-B protein n=1 Tax=Macrostomum lignano TaxID=282301 RepID=A0A1I8JQX8_9PLAT